MTATRALRLWRAIPAGLLPFADAAEGLPLGRLLRLSLVQVSVGMALTLLNGTLNRVMIVEIGVPASAVAAMLAMPLLVAPLRALIGLRSDTHRSVLGWRRVPYIWMGTLGQFGGLALLPMSLMLMAGLGQRPAWIGEAGALFAFLLVGLGLNTAQTAALALGCDLAPADRRPRVVALLWVVLLLSMLASSLLFGRMLDPFTPRRLFAVVSGAAMATVGLNLVALWQQEARGTVPATEEAPPSLIEAWRGFDRGGQGRRLLVAVALLGAAFSMQDVLLEPYGAQVLGLSVGATTLLTALWAAGSLGGFGLAARELKRGRDAALLAAWGALAGVPAFAAVIFSSALGSATLFRVGAVAIGFGGGLASVSLLSAATSLARDGRFGFAVGAWGAVQALSAGLATAVGGALRDMIGASAAGGSAAPYVVVYHLEMALLFAGLVALGPLVTRRAAPGAHRLAEFPA